MRAMSDRSEPQTRTPAASDLTRTRIFRRLLLMLRPQWPRIAVAIVLLMFSLPAELFPGLTWMYVTDGLILDKPTRATQILHTFFSFNGHVTGKFALLLSSVSWMLGVYLFAETFGTLS